LAPLGWGSFAGSVGHGHVCGVGESRVVYPRPPPVVRATPDGGGGRWGGQHQGSPTAPRRLGRPCCSGPGWGRPGGCGKKRGAKGPGFGRFGGGWATGDLWGAAPTGAVEHLDPPALGAAGDVAAPPGWGGPLNPVLWGGRQRPTRWGGARGRGPKRRLFQRANAPPQPTPAGAPRRIPSTGHDDTWLFRAWVGFVGPGGGTGPPKKNQRSKFSLAGGETFPQFLVQPLAAGGAPRPAPLGGGKVFVGWGPGGGGR